MTLTSNAACVGEPSHGTLCLGQPPNQKEHIMATVWHDILGFSPAARVTDVGYSETDGILLAPDIVVDSTNPPINLPINEARLVAALLNQQLSIKSVLTFGTSESGNFGYYYVVE